jgi:hypothetical protein
MTTTEFPSVDAICAQVRDVLASGPKSLMDEVLFDFLRGYMKHSHRHVGGHAAKHIAATLTRCRNGRPLAVLDSEPFNGMEASPADLLALAQTLIRIAGAAVEHGAAPRHLGAKRISMEIENV